MTNVLAFPLPTGCLLPHTHPRPPACPLLDSVRTLARCWPGKAWLGCPPGSPASRPGSGPCQVSDSISRSFLLREPNILSLHPSWLLPGHVLGSKKTPGAAVRLTRNGREEAEGGKVIHPICHPPLSRATGQREGKAMLWRMEWPGRGSCRQIGWRRRGESYTRESRDLGVSP